MTEPLTVLCPYCGHGAELIDSGRVYHKSYGMIWICQPCQAWVGVHKDHKQHKPLGTLANAETRKLRSAAHEVFDPFWKELAEQGVHRGKARRELYLRLRTDMGIDRRACHIAKFDADACRTAIEICARWKREAAEAASQLPDASE